MRADVGEGARRATEALVHAPVPILGAQQPVLEIGAVHEVHEPGLTRADALPRLANGGIEAVDERNRGLAVRRGGCGHELLSARGVHRERLLADHVLAGGERGRCERLVKVVRRADVHDVELRVLDELLGGGGGAIRRAARWRPPRRSWERRRRPSHDAGAREAGGAGVDAADEACPGDSDPKLLRGHRAANLSAT